MHCRASSQTAGYLGLCLTGRIGPWSNASSRNQQQEGRQTSLTRYCIVPEVKRDNDNYRNGYLGSLLITGTCLLVSIKPQLPSSQLSSLPIQGARLGRLSRLVRRRATIRQAGLSESLSSIPSWLLRIRIRIRLHLHWGRDASSGFSSTGSPQPEPTPSPRLRPGSRGGSAAPWPPRWCLLQFRAEAEG